jgi:protein TBF1
MADTDPDLAAQLLAVFSGPTGATGALPLSDLSSLPPLSYDLSQWSDDHIANLLAEQKSEPQPDAAPGQSSLQENSQTLPQGTPTSPPQHHPHTPQHSSPQQHYKQEPQSLQKEPQPHALQQSPNQEDQHRFLKQEPSKDEASPSPSHKIPLPKDPLPQESLLVEALQQPALPQQVSQEAPSNGNLQQHHQHPQQLPQPPIPEPPSSPLKRARSHTAEGENQENVPEKRLKADHHELEHRDVDPTAINWDISAMLQNALGSFDEQVSQPHVGQDHGTGLNPAAEASQAQAAASRKVEQKRMRFSSNPYYVMRTMSLPLLGSLVSHTSI